MTTISFTAPIDLITSGASFSTCNKKCEYILAYEKATFEIEQKDGYLLFKPLFGSTSMIYNGTTYAIFDMRLYNGSPHNWDGAGADAELQIKHKSMNGTSTLVVCVPIKTTSSGKSVNDLVDAGVNYEPNIVYSASRLIPDAKYYTYTGTGQFNRAFKGLTYILFDVADALYISEQKLTDLVTIANSVDMTTEFGGGTDPRQSSSVRTEAIYLSANPPKSGEGMLDDIYIECKPTGDFGVEEVDVKSQSDKYSFNIGNPLNDQVLYTLFKVFIGMFVMLCILQLFKMFAEKVFKPKPSASTA